MKLIVAGGRDYHLTDEDKKILNDIVNENCVNEIIQGGATGVDNDAKIFANEIGLVCKQFTANWKKFGRAAGPIRNEKMAQYGTALLIFPGGIGTQSMLRIAIAHKLKIFKSIDFKQID